MAARVEPSGLSSSPTLHPHQQLVRTKLARRQKPFLNTPLTNLIAALAHRSTVTSFMEISTSTRCCGATRRRVGGWLGSKEVTYLQRLLTNGGRDHDGRGGAGRSVAQAVQGAQEAARCGLPLRPLSGRGPHFRAGDGPGAFSGYYKKGRTTATSSRATGPPSQHARAIRASST